MARERAWLLHAEAGRPMPAVRCGGLQVPSLVVDFDASLVTCYSEKQGAAPNFKHGFGYHPLLVWVDNPSEALAGMLRPGNAGSNTTANHIRLTDRAFAQIPDAELRSQQILVRCDGAGATKEWPARLLPYHDEQGLDLRFSVGFTLTNQVGGRNRGTARVGVGRRGRHGRET